jgi:lysozyme family protein
VRLTAELGAEYQQLFDSCTVSHADVSAVDAIADRVLKNKKRYQAVGDKVTTPWYVVAAIHNLEASQDFTRHLHNGDRLTHRTVQVPADRPEAGHPPFTWEVSASDALTMHGFDAIAAWTVPTMLFQFEKYNGFGYRNRHPEVLSPYLWCFTNHYTKGKFVKDGVFSSTTRSQQCGAVALLLRLQARKDITIGGTVRAMAGHAPVPLARTAPHPGAPPFPGVALARGVSKGDDVCRIQTRLRQLGFTIGVVAGCPFGPQTEAAVIAFQQQHHLRPSGRVGSDTWKALLG